MEWVITVHRMKRYVEIVTSGLADGEGTIAMAKECSELLPKKKIKKIFIDHSRITDIAGHIADVYNRPRELGQIGVIHEIKIAELVKPEHMEFFKFFETVCLNRGFRFAMFTNRAAALEWLLES